MRTTSLTWKSSMDHVWNILIHNNYKYTKSTYPKNAEYKFDIAPKQPIAHICHMLCTRSAVAHAPHETPKNNATAATTKTTIHNADILMQRNWTNSVQNILYSIVLPLVACIRKESFRRYKRKTGTCTPISTIMNDSCARVSERES